MFSVIIFDYDRFTYLPSIIVIELMHEKILCGEWGGGGRGGGGGGGEF